MENIDIRLLIQTHEDIEKFKRVKKFLKQSTNTGVLRFLIDEKYQDIQKLIPFQIEKNSDNNREQPKAQVEE